MKEFMLFVGIEGNPHQDKSPEEMQQHVEQIGAFIKRLTDEGRFISCSPLEFEGVKLRGNKGSITDGPYNESKEVICGYYHILAKDLDEAVAIARTDPRFADGDWTLEVRPLLKQVGINA